jgi:hypothetical protein
MNCLPDWVSPEGTRTSMMQRSAGTNVLLAWVSTGHGRTGFFLLFLQGIRVRSPGPEELFMTATRKRGNKLPIARRERHLDSAEEDPSITANRRLNEGETRRFEVEGVHTDLLSEMTPFARSVVVQ